MDLTDIRLRDDLLSLLSSLNEKDTSLDAINHQILAHFSQKIKDLEHDTKELQTQ